MDDGPTWKCSLVVTKWEWTRARFKLYKCCNRENNKGRQAGKHAKSTESISGGDCVCGCRISLIQVGCWCWDDKHHNDDNRLRLSTNKKKTLFTDFNYLLQLHILRVLYIWPEPRQFHYARTCLSVSYNELKSRYVVARAKAELKSEQTGVRRRMKGVSMTLTFARHSHTVVFFPFQMEKRNGIALH